MSAPETGLAPEIAASAWFNTRAPLTLAGLRGRPVFLHAFQLLCPGCVSDALPQVKRIERVFADTDLQVIGIHTVFEHHAAMTPVTLQAFLHEYRVTSPVAVDLAEDGSDIPVTMRRFGLRGTPSSVLIGRNGAILSHAFGIEDDIAVGARIAMALAAPQGATQVPAAHAPVAQTPDDAAGCADGRCEAPVPETGA